MMARCSKCGEMSEPVVGCAFVVISLILIWAVGLVCLVVGAMHPEWIKL